MAFQIERGQYQYGAVSLDGLGFIVLGLTPEAMGKGNWLLMCLLFVVGVMNLVWVAALAAFVLVEKIGPFGWIVARVAGAIMIVFGLLVVAGLR